MPCSAPSAGTPLVSSLTDYLECHASALGQSGFEGAANGFFMTAMLTGCLTIYVALIGYRLVFGQPYSVREAVLASVRVGLIIAFCTRWPSYEAVFYRTVVEGPQEIASQMLQPSGLPVLSESELAEHLQHDYDAIQAAAIKQPSAPPPSTSPQAPGVALPQVTNAAQPPLSAAAAPGVSVAGLVLLISTIGSLLAVRLAAALLMAIGPLVVLLALFDSLVGFFENWVATLAGTMLATAGVTVVTELQLGFLDARLDQFGPTGAALLSDQGLFLTSLMFSLCIIGVFVAAGLIGKRLKFRGFWLYANQRDARPGRSGDLSVAPHRGRPTVVSVAPPSRATAVSNAVSQEGRRERTILGAPASALASSSGARGMTGPVATSRGDLVEGAGVGSAPRGLGYSLRRPAISSRSVSYARRRERQ